MVIFGLVDECLQILLFEKDSLQDNAFFELPGSPVFVNQSLEETASQCLHSLIGKRDFYFEQLYSYGEPGRSEKEFRLSVVYFAIIPAHACPSVETKIRTLWIPVEQHPTLVKNHNKIVIYALRRLRYKMEYTAIAFELLPDEFTLSELQKTYESILGEKLDKRNFRRRMIDAQVIEATNKTRGGEGRPARLYRYRQDAVAEVKARRLFP